MFSRRTRPFSTILICLLISIFSSVAFSHPASAFIDPISITSQTSIVSFPKGIDFRISVKDTVSTISQGTIFLKYNTDNYQDQHDVSVDKAEQQTTLLWHQNLVGNNYAPVGTEVTYYWRIQDTAGNSYTDRPHTFRLTDTRFQWQETAQGLLHVHWYNHTSDFGQIILNQASTSLKRIQANLGKGLSHPIDLWIYQNTEDFHGSLSPETHEWVGGIAFPSLGEAAIVADTPEDDTLIRDMPHELTHLMFHQIVAAGVQIPTWFDEGLAVYNQSYHEPTMTRRFKEALNNHSLLPISQISKEFPNDADQAYLAYAQSWELISYMYSSFGTAKMGNLIRSMGKGQQQFDDNLVQVLGEDQNHVEDQWRQSLNQPSILPLLPRQNTSKALQKQPQLPTTTDTSTPFLLGLGILLVLLPLFGLTSIFFYQRRKHRHVVLSEQAQWILDTTLSPSYHSTQQNSSPLYPSARYAPPHRRRRDPWNPTKSAGMNGPDHDWQNLDREYFDHWPNQQAPQD